MVTLQDVCFRLMKPAKDLADWSFPLSQVLDEYHALLEDPCRINFGEVALVVQNSANVYAHRIECLHDELKHQKQLLPGAKDEKRRQRHEKVGACQQYLDLEDFCHMDFKNAVGKNINIRNRCEAPKSVKLTSRRFMQLEYDAVGLPVPIHIHDVYGEIMGTKYDFRCNKAANINGLLVDELTPADFGHARVSCIKERRNPSLTCSEENTWQGTVTSGYQSNLSPPQTIATPINAFIEEDVEDKPGTPLNEQDVQDSSGIEANDADNLLSEELHTSDATAIRQDRRSRGSDNGNDSSDNWNAQQFSMSRALEKPLAVVCTDNEEGLLRVNGEEKTDNAEELPTAQRRKPTRMVSDINENIWKPIALSQGAKNTGSLSFTSSMKPSGQGPLGSRKPPSRKRLCDGKARKQECLTEFALHQLGFCQGKADHSGEPIFKPLQRYELEHFQRSFDECFVNRQHCDPLPYEAETDAAMDLLGFKVCRGRDESDPENTAETRDDEEEDEDTHDNRTPLAERSTSPSLCRNWLQRDLPYTLPDYEAFVEHRMKEIFQESKGPSELEQTVAQWHVSLQPKLLAAETRPVFRMHEYASRIVETLQTLQERKIPFDGIVRGKHPSEVARYFLASLQLASTYNVQMNHLGENPEKERGIEIVLLDGKDKDKRDK